MDDVVESRASGNEDGLNVPEHLSGLNVRPSGCFSCLASARRRRISISSGAWPSAAWASVSIQSPNNRNDRQFSSQTAFRGSRWNARYGAAPGQTAGAVAVGVAFHFAGLRVTPNLLFIASLAALAAALISLLRLNVAPQGRVAVYKPILD